MLYKTCYSTVTYLFFCREKFPEKEYASELRQAQAAKWSFHSVTEGIEHFKCGRYTEAFQCLNKALTIDSRNIEALVARGALYAKFSIEIFYDNVFLFILLIYLFYFFL